jgi:hypothetical protein
MHEWHDGDVSMRTSSSKRLDESRLIGYGGCILNTAQYRHIIIYALLVNEAKGT